MLLYFQRFYFILFILTQFKLLHPVFCNYFWYNIALQKLTILHLCTFLYMQGLFNVRSTFYSLKHELNYNFHILAHLLSQTPSKKELSIPSPAGTIVCTVTPPCLLGPSPTGQGAAQSLYSAFDMWLWWAGYKMWAGGSFLAEIRKLGETEAPETEREKFMEYMGLERLQWDYPLHPKANRHKISLYLQFCIHLTFQQIRASWWIRSLVEGRCFSSYHKSSK